MKKIMFNDQFGLTQAVLDGRKTQTRRVIHFPERANGINAMLLPDGNTISYFTKKGNPVAIIDGVYCHSFYKPCTPQYFIGEVVAIAQSYNVAKVTCLDYLRATGNKGVGYVKGFSSKMYVLPDLMPHHIRITNIRIEQICNVTDEDAIKEGVKLYEGVYYGSDSYGFDGFNDRYYPHPQYAYIGLIERMGMRPSDWVFVYDFELVD